MLSVTTPQPLSDAPLSVAPPLFNMAAHVLAVGARRPGATALSVLHPDGAEVWSYARLIAAVRGCGTALLAAGAVPGERVLLRLGNTPAYPVAYLGAIAAGLVAVVTSPALTRAEITRMAAPIAPRLILADPGLPLPDGDTPVLPADPALWEGLPPCDWHMGPPGREGYVVFTSGTSSGTALAVAHAHRAILARAMMHHDWEGLTPQDRLLHAGAFNWTYTMGTGLMDPWTLGAAALIPGAGVAVSDLPGLLQRHQATILAAAPGVFRQMLRTPLPPLPHLRHALSAGEALPPATRAAWVQATGTPICSALGMSEVSTFLSESPTRPAPPGASGYAQTGRRIAVLGAEGAPVPRGQPGVLAIDRNDPGLMLGYLNQPAATAARMRGDWFVTGDMAVMAGDGAVSYLGRDDDLMNAGGFRVSPIEVEGAFAGVPGLAECAAVERAVRDAATVIALFHTGTAAEAALADRAAAALARWKQPRLYIRLDALPRGANNKLNRRALRDHPIPPKDVP